MKLHKRASFSAGRLPTTDSAFYYQKCPLTGSVSIILVMNADIFMLYMLLFVARRVYY